MGRMMFVAAFPVGLKVDAEIRNTANLVLSRLLCYDDPCVVIEMGDSLIGKTPDSGSGVRGSNPCPPAMLEAFGF